MAQNESVERYLSEQYPEKYQSTDPDDKAYISRLRNRINESIGYFESKGITSPHEGNYLELNAWVSLKEGKPKGKPISPKTVKDWVSCTRNYYDWKEGEKQMLFKNEDISAQQAEIEPVSSEGVAVQEVSAPAESEGVLKAEGANAGASADEDTGSLSVATVEPVDESPADDTPAQPKRGRKTKAAAEKRTVKLSIYLTPSIYEGMKTLASATQQDVSDIFFTLAEEYVTRNSDKVQDIRSFFARLGAIR